MEVSETSTLQSGRSSTLQRKCEIQIHLVAPGASIL